MTKTTKPLAVQASAAPTVQITVGIKALLEDKAFVKDITVGAAAFDRLLAQLQRDSTTMENMHEAGPMCCALRKVQEAMILFSAQGNAILAGEKAASEKRSK